MADELRAGGCEETAVTVKMMSKVVGVKMRWGEVLSLVRVENWANLGKR